MASVPTRTCLCGQAGRAVQSSGVPDPALSSATAIPLRCLLGPLQSGLDTGSLPGPGGEGLPGPWGQAPPWTAQVRCAGGSKTQEWAQEGTDVGSQEAICIQPGVLVTTLSAQVSSEGGVKQQIPP